MKSYCKRTSFSISFAARQRNYFMSCFQISFYMYMSFTLISVSSNVSRYSIRKEILLYLVSFCPLMSLTKILHLFNFHFFWWAFCLIAIKHIKSFFIPMPMKLLYFIKHKKVTVTGSADVWTSEWCRWKLHLFGQSKY